jgi:hypothetical protein
MSRLQNLGDFVFGVALLAATPIFVFIVAAFVAAQISLFEEYRFTDYLGRWAILGISFTSFLLACMWRRKHRRLPSSVFPVEVVVSIICGLGFMFLLLLAWYAAGGAD